VVEFRRDLWHQKTRGPGLSCGVVSECFVLVWFPFFLFYFIYMCPIMCVFHLCVPHNVLISFMHVFILLKMQTFDKGAFHSGTPPPPFNMALPSAAQSGATLGGGYGAPYMPMVPHQSHSAQILHHPISQVCILGCIHCHSV